jgi:hypothetical protein
MFMNSKLSSTLPGMSSKMFMARSFLTLSTELAFVGMPFAAAID